MLYIASAHDEASIAVKYHSADTSTFRDYGLNLTVWRTSIYPSIRNIRKIQAILFIHPGCFN
jgi:hypothetical protein